MYADTLFSNGVAGINGGLSAIVSIVLGMQVSQVDYEQDSAGMFTP